MIGTRLRGLEGTNPLGFLAALGVQVAFATEDDQPRIWWSDDITPHAVVDETFTVDRIVSRALATLERWRRGPAVNPRRPDGSAMPRGDDLKLDPEDIRTYLGDAGRQASGEGLASDLSPLDVASRFRFLQASGAGLASALVAEGSLDNKGQAKPADFYFTAGRQQFLGTVRQIMDAVAVAPEEVSTALEGPWRYESKAPSLGWDVTDDRVYALRADDPAREKKPTNPGAEAMALLGLSLYPVFADRGRTATQGCTGSWEEGWYSWPLWRRPATSRAVKSLLAHAYAHPAASNRDRWYRAWSVSSIRRSPIRRGQGGYGTFGPSEVVW